MSRTLHLSLSEREVTEFCRKHAVAISAIEPLVSGGTRLVTMSVEGAEKMRAKLKRDIIKEDVERTPLYLRAGRG
jgi:diketogulonate reductase-like aldo/keto reductase